MLRSEYERERYQNGGKQRMRVGRQLPTLPVIKPPQQYIRIIRGSRAWHYQQSLRESTSNPAVAPRLIPSPNHELASQQQAHSTHTDLHATPQGHTR